MKVELDLESRKYIYAMLKLFAHQETEPKTRSFWALLANRIAPNSTVAHLNKKEVELIIDILGRAVDTVNSSVKSKAADVGQQLRAEMLEKVLAKAKSKLIEKLVINNKDDENGI